MAEGGHIKMEEETSLQEEINLLEKKLAELSATVPLSRLQGDVRMKTEYRENRSNDTRPYSNTHGFEIETPRTRNEFVTLRKKRPMTSTPKEISHSPMQTRPDNENQPYGEPPKPENYRGYRQNIKPATYDGLSSWRDYEAHFEVCAELNRWTYREKGLYLAVSLREQAQGVFGNLGEQCNDYQRLVTALEDRFAPANQTELYRVQLRERRQRATESLSELSQDIRRLTNLAYPTAPTDVKETLSKEQFIDSLVSSDMRLRIKQARPQSLNDAMIVKEASTS